MRIIFYILTFYFYFFVILPLAKKVFLRSLAQSLNQGKGTGFLCSRDRKKGEVLFLLPTEEHNPALFAPIRKDPGILSF